MQLKKDNDELDNIEDLSDISETKSLEDELDDDSDLEFNSSSCEFMDEE